MNFTSRNSPCPCSSGKRFKHCCGAERSSSPTSDLKNFSLASLRKDSLKEVEARYLGQLAVQPDEPDCLYHLGLIYLQTGRAHAALDLILRAGNLKGWQIADMHRNLRYALAAAISAAEGADTQSVSNKMQDYKIWQRQRAKEIRDVKPLVSVIVPSYNHATFINECLESVFAQTWPRIELIVIDDGSRDASVSIINTALKACPFPHHFVARENQGAHATINEGVKLAKGEYINILNSDDRFLPRRIERMVAGIAAIGADFGFSSVEIIDSVGQPAARPPGSMAENLAAIVAATESAPTVGFALLRRNASISTGNLFIRQQFIDQIGGFSDLRYHHDWEFVLRASLASEPVFVPETLYQYRVHDRNTTTEAGSGAIDEGNRMLGARIHDLLTHKAPANPYAPTFSNWGEYLLKFIVKNGFEKFIPLEQIREMAELLTAKLKT